MGYNYRAEGDIMDAVKHINYDPETGEITRVGMRYGGGSIDHYGYLIIKILGIQWKSHRLAWAKFYGKPPKKNIDHIDGDKINNKISNLRDVEQVVNVRNTCFKRNEKTGCVGIYRDDITKGLKAKFTTKYDGKYYRFRDIQDAINFRHERGLKT